MKKPMDLKTALLGISLLIIVALVFVTILALPANAATAFYTGERVSGMYKICYYDHLGDEVAITIDSVDLCPLTIQL